MSKANARNVVRLGKLQEQKGGRSWQMKMYAPTAKKKGYRIAFKDPTTGKWESTLLVNRKSADQRFEELELWLDRQSILRSVSAPLSTANAPLLKVVAAAVVQRLRSENKEPRYVAKVECNLRKHVLPLLGQLPINEWEVEDSEEVIRQAYAKGLSPSTVQGIGVAMRMLVNQGWRRDGGLSRSKDPMFKVKYGAKARHQGESVRFVPPAERPSETEVIRLYEAVQALGISESLTWLPLMVKVSAYTGIRFGELVALTADCYDPNEKVLIVRKSITHDKGGFREKLPKNGKERSVPLPKSLLDEVSNRVDAVKDSGTRLLFPNANGEWWTRHSFRKRVFLPAAVAAGWNGRRHPATGVELPPLVYRSLRHFAITWWIETVSLPVAAASLYAGHSSTSFTMDRYVRRSAESERLTRELLDEK